MMDQFYFMRFQILKDPFEYTMSTVMSAFKAIMKRIEDEFIFLLSHQLKI